MAQASNRTGPEVHHTANSKAAAARGTRPAAAGAADDVAGVGGAVVAVSVAQEDGGPVGRRALWPPTFVVAVVREIRSAPEVVLAAAARSTRDSTWAVHRSVRTAVRQVAVCGGTVCGGTANFGCGGNTRVGGAGHRGKRTDWTAPVDSGPAPEAVAVDTGDWPTPAVTGSMTATEADGTGPAAGNGSRVVASEQTPTSPAPLRCRTTPWAVVQLCRPTTAAWAPTAGPMTISRATDDASERGEVPSGA